MAQAIINKGEVSLDGKHFPIKGLIKRQIVSQFADKITIGDNSYNNQRFLSFLGVKDQRAGILCEEFLTSADAGRSYWSNLNEDYAGYSLLPSLATAITLDTYPGEITDGGLEIWTDSTHLTNWTFAGDGTLARNTADKHSGTYCAAITTNLNSGIATLKQTLTWNNNYRSKSITFRAWGCVTSGPQNFRLGIYDGTTTAWSAAYTDAAYTLRSVTISMAANATELTLILECNQVDAAGVFLFDDCECNAPYTGTITAMAELNNNLYLASGRTLWKLNTSTGATFTYVKSFYARITRMVSSVGNCLYILLGDTSFYNYMTTAEAFTETDSTNATKGIHHLSRLYKINAAGQLSYCAIPNAASPTWIDVGTLADCGLSSGDVNALLESRDASGTMVIYAGTKHGYYGHDDTAAAEKWYPTEVNFGNHPNGGKGLVRWNDADWISSGVSIKKYVSAATASITDEGLDKDGGLPAEYAGEIVKFIKGTDCFYILMDASQTTGLGFSAVYKRTLYGSHCVWDATALDTWTYAVTTSSGTGWSDLANAYDNNTATYASSPSITAGAWSAYAQFNLTAVNSYRLKFYASSDGNGTVNEIDLDTSTDGATWTDCFSGTFTASAWKEYSFVLSAVTNVRIRFKNNHATAAGIGRLSEIQLTSASCNGAMNTGIVSSVYAQRLWFDHNGSMYWISLPRNLTNPKKVSTWTYATKGRRVSPWFDGGYPVFSKTAKTFSDFAKDLTSDETVRLMYRLDHTKTDLFSGWTDLATVEDDGHTDTDFGSSGGIVFKSIQFCQELKRGSTTTLSPDLQGYGLSFRSDTDYVLGWTFTLDLTQTYNGRTPMQMQAELDAIITSKYFPEFTYRDSVSDTTNTHHVLVIPPMPGQTETGRDYTGLYEVSVIEVTAGDAGNEATNRYFGVVDIDEATIDSLDAPTGRTATVVIAAYDAPAIEKAQADVVCDGTDDHDEINTALAAGYSIHLSTGTFNAQRVRIADKSNITITGSGYGTHMKLPVLTQTEADAAKGCQFSFENASYCRLSNMRLDNNGANQTAVAAPGWYWYLGVETDSNCVGDMFDHLWIEDAIGGGIYLSSSNRILISDIYGYYIGRSGAKQRALLHVDGAGKTIATNLYDYASQGGVLTLNGGAIFTGSNLHSDAANLQAAQISNFTDVIINGLHIQSPVAGGLMIDTNSSRLTINGFEVYNGAGAAYPLEFYNGTFTDISFNGFKIITCVRGIYSWLAGATEGILQRVHFTDGFLKDISGGEAYRFYGRIIDSDFTDCSSQRATGAGMLFASTNNSNISIKGGVHKDNGDNSPGLELDGGSGYRVHGVRSYNTAAANIQKWGLYVDAITNSIITGNDFQNNLTAGIAFGGSYVATTNIIKNNLGYTSETEGQLLQANANGVPVDATNTDAEVSAAVTASHAQNTDTGTSNATFAINGSDAIVEGDARLTDDRDPNAHASGHAVGGADTLFPADPGADRLLMWDDSESAFAFTAAGSGDMTKVVYDANDDGVVVSADNATTVSGIAAHLDDTAGGTDAEVAKAPTSNVMYDHGVATTGVHGVGAGTIAKTADITATKIDDLTAPDDNTDLDVSTTAHGLAPKAVAPAAGLINVLGIANGETAITNKALFDATVPSTQAIADAAATGTATVAARRDHKHAMPSAATMDAASVAAVNAAGLILADTKTIEHDPTPAASHTANGETVTMTAGAALAFGDACYVGTDGKMEKALADDAAVTIPATLLCIATIAENDAGLFLKSGWAHDDSWAFDIGLSVYLSKDTAGLITKTMPTKVTGNQVQVLGTAIAADTIYWNPSPIVMEYA